MEKSDLSVPNPEYSEHSQKAKSKRVIDGPIVPSRDPNGDSALSVSAALASPLVLVQGKAYRIISDGDFYMKLSKGVVAATNTDIYVPAGTPVIVLMAGWTHVNTLAGPVLAGTFVQAIELDS